MIYKHVPFLFVLLVCISCSRTAPTYDAWVEAVASEDLLIRRGWEARFMRDPELAWPVLKRALVEPTSSLRAEASSLLLRLVLVHQRCPFSDRLADLARRDENCLVRINCVEALRQTEVNPTLARDLGARCLSDAHPEVAIAGLKLLWSVGGPETDDWELVQEQLGHRYFEVRQLSIGVLGHHRTASTCRAVEALLDDPVLSVREAAADFLQVALPLETNSDTPFTGESASRKLTDQSVPPDGGAYLISEFSPKSHLVIAWAPAAYSFKETFTELIKGLGAKISIVVVVPSHRDRLVLGNLLKSAGVATESIELVHAPVDTVWIRDYSPVPVVNSQSNLTLVQLETSRRGHENDLRMASSLTEFFGRPGRQMALKAEWGNLLSDGRGLVVTSSALIVDNLMLEPHVLLEQLGAQRLLILEPLVGECTNHVDLFATIPAEETILIAKMDPVIDPINAAILDRNAQRATLAGLQVSRVPMPSNFDGVWRSYTNVIYVNDTVLVPSYSDSGASIEAEVHAVYKKVLEEWEVRTANCDRIALWGGALRCMAVTY